MRRKKDKKESATLTLRRETKERLASLGQISGLSQSEIVEALVSEFARGGMKITRAVQYQIVKEGKS